MCPPFAHDRRLLEGNHPTIESTRPSDTESGSRGTDCLFGRCQPGCRLRPLRLGGARRRGGPASWLVAHEVEYVRRIFIRCRGSFRDAI